jgi:ATP dependent DNA ligase domain
MQCKPVTDLPSDEKRTFEIKFDGYRCIAVKRGREVTLFSRNQKVLNKRFPKVVEALAALKGDFVLPLSRRRELLGSLLTDPRSSERDIEEAPKHTIALFSDEAACLINGQPSEGKNSTLHDGRLGTSLRSYVQRSNLIGRSCRPHERTTGRSGHLNDRTSIDSNRRSPSLAVAENGDVRGADNDGDGQAEPVDVGADTTGKDGTYVRGH